MVEEEITEFDVNDSCGHIHLSQEGDYGFKCVECGIIFTEYGIEYPKTENELQELKLKVSINQIEKVISNIIIKLILTEGIQIVQYDNEGTRVKSWVLKSTARGKKDLENMISQ